MKRARLIYNPSSGKELMKRHLPYVLKRLEEAGYEASAHATTGNGDAKKAAQIAILRKYDLVIAAGGDGTIFEVVNGLAEQPYRPILGIIPAGTTNDFARALKIPRDIKKACDILCDGYTRPVDIGKANEKYFVNVAAGGSLTEITYEVPSKLKTILGSVAYYLKGLVKLPFITPTKVRIEYDDKVFDGEMMFFLICNTKSVGGVERLAEKSEFDDGFFDLMIVEKMELPRFVRLGLETISGKHLMDAKIKYAQASDIKITVENDLPLNLDGEYGGQFPAQFKSLHHHFKILVKKEDKQQS